MKFCGVFSREDRPGVWYCYYPDPRTGLRVKEATPFRKEDPAGYRRALEFANEKGKAGLAARVHAAPELWGSWVEKFFDRHYLDPKSRLRAHGAWKFWSTFLELEWIPVPRALDYAGVVRFVAWRQAGQKRNGRPVSRNTALCDLRIMSVVMREAVRMGFAPANPCASPGISREDPREKPEMTDHEIALVRKRLLGWAKKNREPWMVDCFEVAIHQGCRLRETRVDLRDVDFVRDTITFRIKGGHVFGTRLHPGLKAILQKRKAAGETHTCGEVPMLASKRWREFFDSIECPHLSFHCTRVTVVTKLARAGIPEQQAMAYVGHSSDLVHRIYQRLKPADLAKAAAAVTF